MFNEFNENTTARYVRVNIPKQGNLSISELLVFGQAASNCVPPPVSTLASTNITANSARLSWAPVTGAQNYIVRYKGQFVSSYISRTVPATASPLTLDIDALACGTNYEFDVQTDCGSGVLSAPSIQTFQTNSCSNPCVNFTRYHNGDLGDIKAAGKSCYENPTFTVTGAGSGIGGTGDQFQYNYASLSVDEDYIAHISSQDNLGSGTNQAGIMMRDSLTDISRFMYIGKTGNNQTQMIYRSQPGAGAVSTTISNTGASYFRLLKSGTIYSAFYGNSKAGPWTAIGAAQDLHFGTRDLQVGMAVAAVNTDPTLTSTASFDDMTEGTTPLPVQLLNFTANDVQHQYVSLQWQTSQEVNNDHFEVERSINGDVFAKIDSINGAGNSSIVQSYSSIDKNPARGINFYRLKQVDKDGKFTYSFVRIVRFGTTASPIVYPNPVNSVFTAVPGAMPIRDIVIYNSQGKTVQFAMGNSTDEEMKVNISNLPAGIYFLKIKTDLQVYQFKIIKN